MPSFRAIPIWNRAPFIRLLIPVISGILLNWYFPMPITSLFFSFCLFFLLSLLLLYLPVTFRFRFLLLPGLLHNGLMMVLGMLIIHYHYTPNKPTWTGHQYKDSALVFTLIEEPLTENENSYKAVASVTGISIKNKIIPVSGHIILYFRKDSIVPPIKYGNQVVFRRPIQSVKSTGNPGAFNYKQYAAFQDIYHQVFLKPGEWIVLKNKQINQFKQFLITSRENIIAILRTHIRGSKECGLAEAMLIGYKVDLDKDLVQAYSNTGVVHVIAISGLHLGLIYWLLTLFIRPLARNKKLPWVKPIIIISGLWLFSLLTGGSPSVLRSAVMFTCLVTGESLSKETTIYNTLAASAFLLLCYNPFWLWDVGFQLSYLAVLSIVIFNKPLYHLFYFPNKLIDAVWKLMAVTIAAQILTTPISVYYFHQFPTLFLLTNLLAVPLSSIILLGEIGLCIVSFIPLISSTLGEVLHWLISLLNNFIELINHLSLAVIKNLYVTIPQILLLYAITTALSWWLFHKNRQAVIMASLCLVFFVSLRTISLTQSANQRKIIVYNVSQKTAMDFINGRNYFFKGDSSIINNKFLQNFHLTPSRLLHRIYPMDTLGGLVKLPPLFLFGKTRILIIDNSSQFIPTDQKIKVDLVIISKNPRLYINVLLATVECPQIVIDSSNPIWKATQWITDCKAAGIACHSVAINGAFVMNLP